MKPEQKFYQWLRGCFDPTFDWMRVENLVQPGTPDINVSRGGREVWIEAKVDSLLIRKEQFAWGIRRSAVGGHVYLVYLEEISASIYLWKYPILCRPRGQYVQPIDPPDCLVKNDRIGLVNYLFPG